MGRGAGSSYDRLDVIMAWVEGKQAPPMQLTVSGGDRTLPLCSYPAYPKYVSGPATSAGSYTCSN